MEVKFRSRRLQKVFEAEAKLQRQFGPRMARTIMMRMAVFQAASCLAEVPTTKPERCHQLSQDRDEEFAVDLIHPKRLVFVVAQDPIPRNEDGGINKEEVTAIEITEVVDYH